MTRKKTTGGGVFSRGMLAVLVVSLLLLGAAGAMFGIVLHDRAAYVRAAEELAAADGAGAQRTLDGVLWFHDAQEADYVRLAQLAVDAQTDAYAALASLEAERFSGTLAGAADAVRAAALDRLGEQAQEAYADGDAETAVRDFEILAADDPDALEGWDGWLLLARVRSGCTMPALAALYAESETDVLARLKAALNLADGAAALLSNADCAEAFLAGRWSGEGKSLTMTATSSGYQLQTTLLERAVSGHFYLRDGLYSVGADEAGAEALLRFEIVDADTILVTRVSDDAATVLTRQS